MCARLVKESGAHFERLKNLEIKKYEVSSN